ncbi:DNA repair protein RecO [Candidatus Roizmanbacteria bacterium RIFCSPHIGHO2_01_FULL_39_12b]|uniref:DNA repair protein RecO n=1 Tax=Candidatus Roizmanbacteria bacterium RIFCSPHIGHO2_01_FULL_39_12b TaxID=1802030 RepID=A0A1F7GDS3_9BACT|nr:MAG: DNA repair protein RecO [Candidatus Roizmanbacteria bacterium RIFCSPHIGHO2_01_FULL_39_12b]OGK46621.1 MAG: DNA repair protein RecO [Candidatus Roizmanbacteria bacterium RIFCSPLOWO2_01_FULL_39_19]
MSNHYIDEGLVLKKVIIGERDVMLTILSKTKGKLEIRAFGVKKITSRRIGHLETGNYIKFILSNRGDRLALGETELLWGYSNIKDSKLKMEFLYLLFTILNKILPIEQSEQSAFELVLDYLKKLNGDSNADGERLDTTLKTLLLSLGYIDNKTAYLPLFNPVSFVEDLVNQKINKNYLR